MNETVRDAFWLMALLIVVAYFVGAATDTNALANGLTKLVLALTGRDPSTGQFASYPSGATYTPS